MNLYFFHKEEYARYYNCVSYNVDDIPLSERQHIGVGISFILIFIFFAITYVPTLTIMCQRKFLKNSCYKIMFVMGLFDVLCIFINALATGIFSILGYVFCSSPDLIYILGTLGLALWMVQSSCGILLAFNRWLELSHPALGAALFHGNRSYVMIAIPVVYATLVVTFSHVFFFNGITSSWFFNPHEGYIADDSHYYNSYVHSVHNVVLIVCLVAFYIVFFMHIFQKAHGAEITTHLSAQKQSLIQVAIICAVNIVAASIYVYMQLVPTDGIIILIGQYAWVLAHGAPSIIYLTVNRSIQTQIKHICKTRTWSFFSTSVVQINIAKSSVQPQPTLVQSESFVF